jgi:hypothetical protein
MHPVSIRTKDHTLFYLGVSVSLEGNFERVGIYIKRVQKWLFHL